MDLLILRIRAQKFHKNKIILITIISSSFFVISWYSLVALKKARTVVSTVHNSSLYSSIKSYMIWILCLRMANSLWTLMISRQWLSVKVFFNGIEFCKQPIKTLQPPMKILLVRYMLTFILIFQSNENYSFVSSVICLNVQTVIMCYTFVCVCVL